jgi:hypothetical protein
MKTYVFSWGRYRHTADPTAVSFEVVVRAENQAKARETVARELMVDGETKTPDETVAPWRLSLAGFEATIYLNPAAIAEEMVLYGEYDDGD